MNTNHTSISRVVKISRIVLTAAAVSEAGKYHVFADYSGHTRGFDVRVRHASHDYLAPAPGQHLYRLSVYLDMPGSAVDEQLDGCLEHLEWLLHE